MSTVIGQVLLDPGVDINQADSIYEGVLGKESDDFLISLHSHPHVLNAELLGTSQKFVPWLRNRVLVRRPRFSPLLILS